MARAPETRFTRSGDVDIAYQIFGGGERDIVMTMGWVTHLEVMWELPELAYFLERLGSMGRWRPFRVAQFIPCPRSKTGVVGEPLAFSKAPFRPSSDANKCGNIFPRKCLFPYAERLASSVGRTASATKSGD